MMAVDNRYRRCCIYACLVFVGLFSTQATATGWWLLGVSSLSTADISDPLQEGDVDCLHLATPANLTSLQLMRCLSNRANKEIIRALSKGIRKGIVQCQRDFSKNLWNCTTFNGANLFGKFVNDKTRETGVINALMTAGGARSIAEGCRQEYLSGCTCVTNGRLIRQGTNFTFFDCNSDTTFASNFITDFTKSTNPSTAAEKVDNHNIDVGLKVANKTILKCRCHGASGACTIRTCFLKSPEMSEIGAIIRSGYTLSVQVELESNQLVRKDRIPSPITQETQVYTGNSPNFCNTDFTKGTIGTANRPCQNDPTAIDYCGLICCHRGAHFVVEEVHDECCSFVWCCRIECNPCNFRNVTHYFCNP